MDRMTRLLAAGLLFAGGAIHLQLWWDGYRGLPTIGPLFLLNVVASGAAVIALLLGRGRWPIVAGAAVATGSVAALVLSRTVGFLGFMELVWNRPALQTLAAEISALVALAASFVLHTRRRPACTRVSALPSNAS